MTANNKKIGSAMVVGGGIGGMQAALDLAESGIKVYLVENKPCIGGVMSQLDKTFPTNDCAMCTMSPRLVEIGRHKDIEIITLSDVENIEGEPGNFKVTLKKKARYIDEARCTGCSECQDVCPIEISDEYNMNLINAKAVYRLYPQAIPNTFAIKKLGQAPCRFSCPIGQRAEGYIALIRGKRYEDAYRTIRRDNPFPSVCGRVCVHPCEKACTRGEVDEPVSIMRLKRFVADWVYEHNPDLKGLEEEYPPLFSEKIAVIGSGSSGLTCAYDLVKRGYSVTVFEAEDKAGGMMALSIPAYRLPKDILEGEINLIKKAGVKIETNSKVTELNSLKADFNAIYLAIGCQKNQSLRIEGEDLEGVMPGLDFLKEVNRGREVKLGEKVAVIGGGNVAMDSVRTALRLGAKEAFIVYRRSRAEMPASEEEIQEVEEEGIKIHFLSAPNRIKGVDGKVDKLECVKMELGPPDDTGRRRPIRIEGSEFTIDVDNVIAAIGQVPDTTYLKDQVEITTFGTLKVDSETLETTSAGIFAGGDVVSGPATVVEAIASGHKAADRIDKFLRGEEVKEEEIEFTKVELSEEEIKRKIKSKEKRQKPKSLPVDKRKANFEEVHQVYTEEEAIAEANRCLECGICSECLMCVEACKAEAIDHSMPKEELLELDVGAVILAPGYEIFDANLKQELGYDRYQNVITALEFERILSASGPFQGKILRPSDNSHPKRIAFIQCVGSREVDRNYCSSVCCMYATKEAIIAKEHEPDIECTIFFIDLRAFGKGFDAYYERAKELGIRYIRCRPSSIKEVPQTKNLKIQYQAEDGEIKVEEFDLVSLSTGLQPPKSAKDLSEKFGIKLNEHNFCYTSPFSPVSSTRDGIYVCGPFTEPKDIPESVMQASGAASKALSLLKDVKGSLITPKEYPPEIDVTGQEPRIGVFVCHCGTNIAAVVDVPSVVEYAKTLANVVHCEDNLYTCSADTCERIKQMIKEHNLNRVIVASCTPRTHEPLFRSTIQEAGLNPYLFEMANIRDQCSWVHMREGELATKKSKDLVRMAVAKARLLEPLYKRKVKINKAALVIGGGLSGMVSALELANQEFDVHLIEREGELGGNLRRIHYLFNGEDPQKELKSLIEKVKGNDKIHLFTSAKIESVEGFFGNFKTRLTVNGERLTEIEHGVIIVATGAKEYKPKEYLYGQDERIITQLELEEKLSTPHSVFRTPQSVVMIQCVGSRDEERPYCSRVCCSEAVKNALKIKEVSPDTNVYILYRDVRTYGFRESYYREARDKGVVFLRYEDDKKPEVKIQKSEERSQMSETTEQRTTNNEQRITISLTDPILNTPISIDADLLVLSAGTVADEDANTVAQLLKVPLDQDNFFLEAHMKLRPIDFAADGIFLCGLAHASKSIEESIIQATGAAARASTILNKDEVELEACISEVVDENCDGCAYCIDPCPYDALTLIEYIAKDGTIKKTVERDEAACKGCGVCQATCPKKGIFVRGFKLEQISAQVEAALQPVE